LMIVYSLPVGLYLQSIYSKKTLKKTWKDVYLGYPKFI
jgi:hypothetical protein